MKFHSLVFSHLDYISQQHLSWNITHFFSIHPHSGELILINSLLFDHLKVNTIILEVTVCDNGSPSLNTSFGLNIL